MLGTVLVDRNTIVKKSDFFKKKRCESESSMKLLISMKSATIKVTIDYYGITRRDT